MYHRHIEYKILELLPRYRCLTIVGPRQSGKTTLCKKLFPDFAYFSFENPDILDLIETDPRGFLDNIATSAIFDEVQKTPEIISYLQEILDDKKDSRKFILTGSNNLQLSSRISQSLAGRSKIFHLLPLQRSELPENEQKKNLDLALLYGSYPRIYDEKLEPAHWLGDYLQTYIEKDVRNTINIENLRSFSNFLRLLAGRAGQLLSYSSLAGDAGITHPTAKKWISALETTFICFSLQPHYKNFNKRITKAPKVYFYDTGLLCYLLRIKTIEQLQLHPLRGAIFENWVISEYMKHYANSAEEAPLYFWRDQHGHEVDLVIDNGVSLDLIEIKSSKTFQKDFLKNINWLNKLQDKKQASCIYGGDKELDLGDIKVIPWSQLDH